MSTHTENPPVQPSRPDSPQDEYTGAFGFFRKYQKIILYTAGIFALVTFSITTSVTDFFGQFRSGTTGELPTIKVDSRTVPVEIEDMNYGSLLARNLNATFGPGQPRIVPDLSQAATSTDLTTCFAILRRASIAEGLDVSMTEVERAIDWLVQAWNTAYQRTDSATQFALSRGMSSLAQYRDLVKEAMRVGNYMRLHALGVDTSDAALLDRIVDGQENIAVRAAVFDMKALEQQLRTDKPVGDEELRAWFDKLEDKDKNPMQVHDTNKVSLRIGAAMFADFDPAQWQDQLAQFKFGDEQKKQLYEAEKALRFKAEKEGEFKPLDDETVQQTLLELAQVEEVLNSVLGRLREQQREALKQPTEELQRSNDEREQALADRDAAKVKSEAKPEDAELKQALRLAEERLTAMEGAVTSAEAAIAKARREFDFRARFLELTKDQDGNPKKGFTALELPDQRNATALEDLSAVGLGKWPNSKLATSLQNAGELGSMPARAEQGGFLFQIVEVEVRPLKPWDEIKSKVEEAYFIDQAKKVGADKKQLLTDALLRLAKEKIPDKIAEIEGRRQGEIDKRAAEWESKWTAQLAAADEWLGRLEAGSQAHKAYTASRDEAAAQLARKDERRREIETEVGKDLETEIATEARKKYHEVFEAAAQEAGFTVSSHGPLFRQLSSEPWWNKRYDATVVFLWGGHLSTIGKGEVSEVLEDVQNRRWVMAACDDVTPRKREEVTRREFMNQRKLFAENQVRLATQQSFTLEALKDRYDYKQPGKQEETTGDGQKPGDNGTGGKPNGK